MLGGSLLVAPVFSDTTAKYYLPPGRWTDLLTGAPVDGGRWFTEDLDFMRIPLFVRENTLLATSPSDRGPEYRFSDGLELQLFEPADGEELSAEVFDESQPSPAVFRCRKKGRTIVLEGDNRLKDVGVLLRNTPSAGKVENGAIASRADEGLAVKWKDVSKPLSITLA